MIKTLLLACLGLAASMLLSLEASAGEAGSTGSVCPEQSEQRPYVCDIGPAKPLSMKSFKTLLRRDAAIRATVARIGMPDAVEIQQVLVDLPWEDHEIRAYYRAYDRVYVFGRAFILGEPEVSMLRHEGPIPEVWLASRRPVDVEARIRSAEEAAVRAEARAERAERIAEQAEQAAEALARDFPRRLVKN